MENEQRHVPEDILARTILLRLTKGEFTGYELMKLLGPYYEGRTVGPISIHSCLFELYNNGLIERRKGEVEIGNYTHSTHFYRLTENGLNRTLNQGLLNEDEYLAYLQFREQNPYDMS